MKKILLALTILLTIRALGSEVLLPTARANTVEYPKWIWSDSGIEYWAYWLSEKVVVNINETLLDVGVRPTACVYRDLKTHVDTPYYKLGRCFYEQFIKTLNNQDNLQRPTGKIYFWLETDKGRTQKPISVLWTPPRGHFWNLLVQVIQMKFEQSFNFFTDKIYFKDFLLGELVIEFPDDPLYRLAIKESILSESSVQVKIAEKVTDAHFKLEPKQYENRMITYSGFLNLHLYTSQEKRFLDLQINTNVNVLQKKRLFNIKGHLQTKKVDNVLQ